MKSQCKPVPHALGKATGIAKEHSINKISIVMIVSKFKIMRSGPKTNSSLSRRGWRMWGGLCHTAANNLLLFTTTAAAFMHRYKLTVS